MFIILTCMVFNIINSFRNKDIEKTWFDSNAIAGLVFYGSIVLTVGLFISGKKLPADCCAGSYVCSSTASDVPEGASYQPGRKEKKDSA